MRVDFTDPNVWGPAFLFLVIILGAGLIFYMIIMTMPPRGPIQVSEVPEPEPVVAMADGVTPVLYRVACVDKSGGTKRCVALIQAENPEMVEGTTHIKLLIPGEEVPQ